MLSIYLALLIFCVFDVKSRKISEIRNQYSHITHLTQDTIRNSDKNTRKYHIQETQVNLSQQVTTRLQNRNDHDKKHK